MKRVLKREQFDRENGIDEETISRNRAQKLKEVRFFILYNSFIVNIIVNVNI